MTGTIELSDQDVQDLVNSINAVFAWGVADHMEEDERERLRYLKARLLKVEVNES